MHWRGSRSSWIPNDARHMMHESDTCFRFESLLDRSALDDACSASDCCCCWASIGGREDLAMLSLGHSLFLTRFPINSVVRCKSRNTIHMRILDSIGEHCVPVEVFFQLASVSQLCFAVESPLVYIRSIVASLSASNLRWYDIIAHVRRPEKMWFKLNIYLRRKIRRVRWG